MTQSPSPVVMLFSYAVTRSALPSACSPNLGPLVCRLARVFGGTQAALMWLSETQRSLPFLIRTGAAEKRLICCDSPDHASAPSYNNPIDRSSHPLSHTVLYVTRVSYVLRTPRSYHPSTIINLPHASYRQGLSTHSIALIQQRLRIHGKLPPVSASGHTRA